NTSRRLAAIFALSAYRAMEAASASRQGRRVKSVMTRSYPNSLNTSLNVTTSMKPIRATKPTVFTAISYFSGIF
ncbi:Transcriptional regulator, partial [Dysosmobacter welbionis]